LKASNRVGERVESMADEMEYTMVDYLELTTDKRMVAMRVVCSVEQMAVRKVVELVELMVGG
jgi:hypothetical protein